MLVTSTEVGLVALPKCFESMLPLEARPGQSSVPAVVRGAGALFVSLGKRQQSQDTVLCPCFVLCLAG